MSRLIESLFPALIVSEYQITSPETPKYNCIAWAAEDDTAWWWPDAFGDYYWPEEAPRQETIEAFIAAFGLLGYHPCANMELETDFEKIAIYVDANGVPTHAAKQLPSGKWTSKLGRLEDIEHATPENLTGDLYGSVAVALRRGVSMRSTEASE